jgi:hypothetical protein
MSGVASRRRWAIACLVLGIAASEPAWRLAQSQTPDARSALPERPTVATHAHTIAAGHLELETGVQ